MMFELMFDFTEPGLSTGGIAGIVVVVAVGLLLLVGYFGFYRKKKAEKIRLSTASEDPSTHGKAAKLAKVGMILCSTPYFCEVDILADLQLQVNIFGRRIYIMVNEICGTLKVLFMQKAAIKKMDMQASKEFLVKLKEAHEIFGNVDDLLKRRKQGLTEMSGFDDPPGRRNELRNIGGFDPTILSEKYMTEKDDNIRNIDFPKRLQLRNMIHLYRRIVETSELPIVKDDVMRFLDFIHIQKLDVSFIAMYRKDECPSLFKDPEQLEADGLQNSYDKKPALMWHKLFGGSALTLRSGAPLLDSLPM
ncbi:hypothetical protein AgCh_000606 [Apium graveolens]